MQSQMPANERDMFIGGRPGQNRDAEKDRFAQVFALFNTQRNKRVKFRAARA